MDKLIFDIFGWILLGAVALAGLALLFLFIDNLIVFIREMLR